MMDPKPGRCRRTDGKKWRCSKNVIPDQKYCEQHMHRGRRRSRKPVEPSQITSPELTLTKCSNKVSENSKNLSAPVSFQYMNSSSCNTITNHETTATTAMDSKIVCSNKNSISANASTSSSIITETNNNNKDDCKRNKNSRNTSDMVEEKHTVSVNNINRSINGGNKATIGNSASSRVGVSPKSVLQGSATKAEIELEPGRCRRTDGKRWRCSRDVIPDQKYCARHMHRGARQHMEVSQPVAIPIIGDCLPSRLTIANKAACAAPSTSHSISIPSPQLATQDEKSMSSSSETTISDTTITVFENDK